jgi:hypothetical protein
LAGFNYHKEESVDVVGLAPMQSSLVSTKSIFFSFNLWAYSPNISSTFFVSRCFVGGKRDGYDNYDTLRYVAEWRIGANALWKSYIRRHDIRVFRKVGIASHVSRYRYGGLYRIVKVIPPSDVKGGTFQFYLNRKGASLRDQHQSKDRRGWWANPEYDERTLGVAGILLEFSGRCSVQESWRNEEEGFGQGLLPFELLLATGSLETTSSFFRFSKEDGEVKDEDEILNGTDEDDYDHRYDITTRPRIRLWHLQPTTGTASPVASRTRSAK